MPEAIMIWRFEDAPEEYRKMSTNGGDEDWLALVPPNYSEEYIGFLDGGTSFGCCNVDQYNLKNGYVLLIGSHA